MKANYPVFHWECPQHGKTGKLSFQILKNQVASKLKMSPNEVWDMANKNITKFIKEHGN
jgi:hypothetical protein